MARGCLGHSDHEVIWFNVFSVRRKKKSRVATLGFRRPNFKIFKKPFSRLSWEFAFEGLQVCECKSVFKNYILEAQEQAIPLQCKWSKRGKRPPWLNREILMELKRKRKLYDLWKWGQALQESYRAVVHICREKTQKAEVQSELRLASDLLDNEKGFLK